MQCNIVGACVEQRDGGGAVWCGVVWCVHGVGCNSNPITIGGRMHTQLTTDNTTQPEPNWTRTRERLTGQAATFYKECGAIERLIDGDGAGGGDGTADVEAEAARWAIDDTSIMAALAEKEKTVAASFEAELSRCKDAVAAGSTPGSSFMTEP